MERDEVGKGDPIFPATGNPVVPLTQVVDDEKTLVAEPRRYLTPLYVEPVYVLPEEALSFTVDEVSLREKYRQLLQPRGLLRLKDSYLFGHLLTDDDTPSLREVKQNHIELLFAVREEDFGAQSGTFFDPNFGAQLQRNLEVLFDPKCRIHFEDIESVTFKRLLLRPKLIIKLKPEKFARYFAVDTIIREVVLYVSHKDAQLARRLQSVIMSEISNANLQRLLDRR
jgi:hypothetical protein